jgi:hypothetical protein
MATIAASPPRRSASSGVSTGASDTVNLATAQTGTGPTTNVLDRGPSMGPVLVKIVSTVGATPTVTVAVEGSADGTNYFNIAYATAAAPETPVVATFAITTATTTYVIVRPNVPVRYVRLTLSANTNVTLTVDAWPF